MQRQGIRGQCPSSSLNATGLSGGEESHASIRPLNICRLATTGQNGETGNITNKDEALPSDNTDLQVLISHSEGGVSIE